MAAESIHAPGFVMAAEQHPFHELFFLFRGSLRVYTGPMKEAVYLTESSVFPVGARTRHRMEDQSGAVLLILAFSHGFIESNPTRASLWKMLVERGSKGVRPGLIERERIERSFRTIFAEQQGQRPGHELLVGAEADSILVSLVRLPDHSSERNSHVRVQDVLRSLEESFFDDWDIETAARRAHLSRRRFSQIFRELAGMSFIDKRNELRLDYAAARIADGTSTIVSASFSSGFGDLAHFYRLFARRFGCSPGKWEKRHREELRSGEARRGR
ncbi:helix-turn-helix domain-containing protein [bacterium]|nr:helix-turn-helix domain-containing protein [bacterium]